MLQTDINFVSEDFDIPKSNAKKSFYNELKIMKDDHFITKKIIKCQI
jgi:hypothetical protein